MRTFCIALFAQFLISFAPAAEQESEICFTNKSTSNVVVSGTVTTRKNGDIPFLIRVPPQGTAYFYSIGTLDPKTAPGFTFFILEKNAQSAKGESPLTRQLLVEWDAKGIWHVTDNPSLDAGSSTRDGPRLSYEIGFPSFSNIKCEVRTP